MFETLFEFLFKHPPQRFAQGDFGFTTPWPVALALGIAVLVALPATLTYLGVGGKSRPLDRGVLAALRLAALGVLVFCLLQPALVLSTVVPQRNFLGIVVDDSRSMSLPGPDGTPRSAFVTERLGGEESALLEALAERFSLRFFRFSAGAERLEAVSQLTWDGTRTRIGPALDRAREELSGVPLSGLVVVTDGADNSGEPLTESLVPLQAAGVPVFTVGLGEERFERDIQLSRVETPTSVLQGTSLLVDVVVAQTGFDGATVPLVVEDGNRILSTQDVTLAGSGEPVVARVRFTLPDPGPRRLRFRIPPQEGERVDRNNARDVLVDVRDRREKVLYFEGEPRFEVKFLRRAVADDENLQVVVLQRTAENKFLRLDVDHGDELVGGFPRTRDELFAYRALILGSVEASFFTADQLDMIADFVSRRGGSLLVLGGRRSFAEGGWAGTAVEAVLPVDVPEEPERWFDSLRVVPTRSGLAHAALRLADDEEASAEAWSTLPRVTALNRIEELKPGATALLTGEGSDENAEQIVLAWQRYGRGKAVAFPVQDSWMWQMSADVPLDDLRHEIFWRQMLRWLVDGVPERVAAEMSEDRVEPGEPVTVRAEVTDSAYLDVNDAEVRAEVTRPDGTVDTLRLPWTVEEDGAYALSWTPAVEGLHEIRVEALRDGTSTGVDTAWVDAGPGDEEYFDAALQASTLRRIAEETGGRYYTPSTVASLPDDVRYAGAGVTVVEELDLWDMPALFFLLVGLIGGEWVYRRARGLA